MKLCPHCGADGDALGLEQNLFQGDDLYAVYCYACGSVGPQALKPVSAEMLWDTRTTDTPSQGE